MWLTDEQETGTNLYKRRLSDGLFAIGRKRFLKTLHYSNSLLSVSKILAEN